MSSINFRNAYSSFETRKRQFTDHNAWLTQRLNTLKEKITLQEDQKENLSGLQKQKNQPWFQNDSLSLEQEKIKLTHQINAHLDLIEHAEMKKILKTTLSLPHIETPEELSFLDGNKKDLRKTIFNHLIKLYSKNSNNTNTPILSNQQIQALDTLLKIIDESTKDNFKNLVAIWVKEAKNSTPIHDVDSKKIWSFFRSKNKLFDNAFLESIKNTAELSANLKEADHPYAKNLYRLIKEENIDNGARPR